MGYRPEFTEIRRERRWYGTKLYGYVDDTFKLESCKWLVEKGWLVGDEAWGFCMEGRFMLTADEFREWFALYNADFKNEYGYGLNESDTEYGRNRWSELKAIIDSDLDKYITWG